MEPKGIGLNNFQSAHSNLEKTTSWIALKTLNLSELQLKNISLGKDRPGISLSEIFGNRYDSDINAEKFYVAYFSEIPNCINVPDIDCMKANEWFAETYRGEIKDVYFKEMYLKKRKQLSNVFEEVYYFLYDDLIVYMKTTDCSVKFFFRETNYAKIISIVSAVMKFLERKPNNPKISLLVYKEKGLVTEKFDVTKPKLNINDNYNDDFKDIHKVILKKLKKRNDKGLVLLHGKPGTGKTSYIRYLLSLVKKKVIFLPPNMAAAITNPELISVLIKNSNSIFVIEDAENIIVDRERNGYSPVSALLNITDGLLSDCLNIQIICSFNTDISKVDNALMRKGRLIAKYEFKELEKVKAQMLSDKLGFNATINSPMTLSAIYNQEEKDFEQTKKNNQIGFRAGFLN
ncbi:MAG: AAA family ATPase [Ginsengibacter sp.]